MKIGLLAPADAVFSRTCGPRASRDAHAHDASGVSVGSFAAETLCESAATGGKKEGPACVNQAVDNAVVRLNRPLLSQYHQLRTKGVKAGIVQPAKAN